MPTPLSKTRTPDVQYIVSAAESVAANLRPGQLIVLQSTTYPGTTEEIVQPILERTGAKVGKDFFLGYAPERVDPGNGVFTIQNTPKLVAGVTEECLRRTELLYRQIVDVVIPVSRPMVAETAKLHENTFRAVNIALANELALMCDRLGISPWEVIEAASSKPFGFLPHFPGPGLGGDCIPVVPHFLAWRLREYGYAAQLIEAAHEINARMPLHVVQKVSDALNDQGLPIKGARLLLLGVAYKGNVHDTRESPSLEVMNQLVSRGGDVRYCDPWVPFVDLEGTRHETRRSGRPRRCARPTASSCSRRTASSSSSRSGTRRAWSWTRATSSRPGPTSTPSSPCGSSCSAPATSAARSARQALARGDEVVLADNWYATDRGQLSGLDAPGRDGRHPRARGGRAAARRGLRPRRLPRGAGEPAALGDRARLHRGDEPHRHAARRRVRAAGRRSSPSAARSTSTAAGRGSAGEIGADQPYGAAGRPRAPLEDLRRAGPRHARARRPDSSWRRSGSAIVYGPSPVEHDRPESQTVVDKFRKLAAAGARADDRRPRRDDRRRARARTRRGSCSRQGRASRTSSAETLTVGDVAALVRGEPPTRDADLHVLVAVRVPARASPTTSSR